MVYSVVKHWDSLSLSLFQALAGRLFLTISPSWHFYASGTASRNPASDNEDEGHTAGILGNSVTRGSMRRSLSVAMSSMWTQTKPEASYILLTFGTDASTGPVQHPASSVSVLGPLQRFHTCLSLGLVLKLSM